MVTHICRELGWTVEYVLEMPARRFFAMYTELLKQEQKRKSNFFYDLCDVQAISICNAEYYKELKEFYRMAALPIEVQQRIEKRKRHIFDASDEQDSKRAAQALQAMMGAGMVMANG